MNMRQLTLFVLVLSTLISCTYPPSMDFQSIKQPKISLVGLKLSELKLAAQKFLVKLQLENPNDQSFSVNGIDLAIALNGKELAKGVMNRPLSLAGHGSSTVEVEAVANALAMLEQGMILAQKKYVDYNIHGHLSVLPGVFSWVKLPLSYSGRVTWQQLQKGIELAQGLAK